MTKILYKEWVEALRGGDYNQTKETLKGELPEGGLGYCCLGVLADIMGHDLEVEPYVGEGDVLYDRAGPRHIYDMFKDNIGKILVDELIDHNDEGMPFKEIADIIEKEKT